MDGKLESILSTLNTNIEKGDFKQSRDTARKRYLFLGGIDLNNQYIVAITDICLQDNSKKSLASAIQKAIPLIKDNPDKTILIRSSLVIELEVS